MITLGLSVFADASAALIENGKIICAVEEERLNRIKHYDGMPYLAVDECLRIANLNLSDVDIISIGWNPLLGWKTRICESLKMICSRSSSLAGKLNRGNNYFTRCMDIFHLKTLLVRKFHLNKINAKIVYVPHHLAHAASVYLTSRFDQANILIADGVAEAAAISFFQAQNNKILPLKVINYPHSLGHIYASVTGFLGFKMTCDEGKVMALAGFGQDEYQNLFRRLIKFNGASNNMLSIDTSILDYHNARIGVFSHKWRQETNLGPRSPDESLTCSHNHLANSLQNRIEAAVLHLLNQEFASSNRKPLCAAGGLFLNSVLNGKIITNFNRNFYVFPAAGDNGVSVGAALYADSIYNPKFLRTPIVNASWGADFSQSPIRYILQKRKIHFRQSDYIYTYTANLLAQGKIIAWFQGKMEFGPRALGNRSILALPQFNRMKDALNLKVKHRESFRPFACAVLLDEARLYFDHLEESPFMLKVFRIKDQYLSQFPAIRHIDNSCRIQTVTKENNYPFYLLLHEIKKLTGYGLVLNTSMNVAGEPIINTPQEAVDLILNTDLDYLILDDFIVSKQEITLNYDLIADCCCSGHKFSQP